MFAVIKTGGKQYKVAPEDVIVVEKLAADAGSEFVFEDVLVLGGDAGVEVGAPVVEGARVVGEIVEQRKGDKVLIIKNRRRNTYKRTRGHRQLESVVKITSILGKGDKAPAKKAAAKPKAEAPAGGDDLSLIGGVGPVLVKKLNDLGITTFAQIAAFTPEQIAEVDEKLSFKGRIEREDWIGQAKELMAGGAPRAKTDQKAAKKAADKDA